MQAKTKWSAVPAARLILCHNAVTRARICRGMPHTETKKARLRGPFLNVSSSTAAVRPAMVVPARAEVDRLQLEAGNAGGDVQSGLALHAERLQRVGIRGTAHQEVAAATDADRCIGAD